MGSSQASMVAIGASLVDLNEDDDKRLKYRDDK
jgi:hypothetical protein